MSNNVCGPCLYKQFITASQLTILKEKTKQRAITNNEYRAIYFDKEDKKYYSANYDTAKSEGYEITEIISPY